MVIADPLVGAEQAHFFGHRAANESRERGGIDAVENARHDIAFALDGSGDWRLARAHATSPAPAAALVPMRILGLPADEGFVHFHDAHELRKSSFASPPRTRMHICQAVHRSRSPSCGGFGRADPLLAREHEMDDAEPLAEGLVVFSKIVHEMREAVALALRVAFVALPRPWLCRDGEHLDVAAARAGDTIGPAVADKVCAARILVREGRFKLRDGHLVDGLFRLSHGLGSLDLEKKVPWPTGKVKHNRPNLNAIPPNSKIRPMDLRRTARAIATNYGDTGAIVMSVGRDRIELGLRA